MTRRGFPHSDIPGSKLVCSSPRLFAANRVLHRLLAPRHSPCALSSLTIGIQELTIGPDLLHCSGVATVPLPNPHLETLRVFCGYGKNYRLQNIQLRKNNHLTSNFESNFEAKRTHVPGRGNRAAGENSWWRIPVSNR